MLIVDVKKSFGNDVRTNFSLDISFSVGNGFTVLSGPSGSGKTTTLQLIAGIIKPDGGVIKLNEDTYFDSEKNVNRSVQDRRVGFVFQDYALFPHLTAAQNIAYGIKKSDQRVGKTAEMLAMFHIEHVGNRLPRDMSGGEQQRVAVARALASDPAIVLLDEPLSAVDVEMREKLLDEIEAAQVRTNIPFIYVTHNEAEAVRFGRQLVVLKDGTVAG